MVKHAPVPVEIDYPSSDGLPLAESDFQFDPLTYARGLGSGSGRPAPGETG